jgi:4'-phosphopantetheinyl transferase
VKQAGALSVVEPGLDLAALGIDLQLWRVDLDAPSDGDAAALPQASVQRAARFVHEADRRRYLASHRALRALLGDVQPWTRGSHGKPQLAVAPPHFNLSRREGVAAIALSATHEVGVDVETLRPIEDARALAALHFSAAERAAAAVQGDAAFLRVWTRKEACMKATGLGLSLAPASFECGSEGRAQVSIRTRQRDWTLLVHTPRVDAPLVLSWAVVLEPPR